MNSERYMDQDGSILIFNGLHETELDDVYHLIRDEFVDDVTCIKIGNDKILLPSKYEIVQTEEFELDFIPVTDLLPISLFTINGVGAINEIKSYESYQTGERIHWSVPSLPKGIFLVIDRGLVVNTNPNAASRFTRDVF